MGPFIVGFDTIGFYVPNTLLWLHNGVDLGDFLATAPLFYTFFTSIVAVGGSPVWVLKIIPPLLLGLLGLSMYAYAKRGLGWSPSKSVFVSLLGTIYFVALRASWDQLREELGLIFFFVVLMLLINQKFDSRKKLHFSFFSNVCCSVISSISIGTYVWGHFLYMYHILIP